METEKLVVAILAGGLATRLAPVAGGRPKALVEVAGRPFVEHQLTLLRDQGVRRVVLCVGHLGEQIESHLGDGRRVGVECLYSYDGPRLLGTGGALRQASPLLGPVFGVLYGDTFLDIDYAAVADEFTRRAAPALMTVLRNAGRWDRSNVAFRDGWVVRYDKAAPSADMTYIDYGFSILDRKVLDRIPPGRRSDLGDLYRSLAAEGRLAAREVTQRFYELGTPASLAETRAFLEARLAPGHAGAGTPGDANA